MHRRKEALPQCDAYIFDIDGTLLVTRDLVHWNALRQAMLEVYGVDTSIEGISYHGKTDISILRGGERHRISLARAFLRDSPVLILDEPTSSIDQQTEQSILEATEALMRNRTTFMIAHRLNTLRSCDTILVLDQGRLFEVQHPKSAAVGV